MEKIKNESYFKCQNKTGENPIKRNQSLHCQYHQERGHKTEDYRILWSHLEQLIREGKLKQFLYQPDGQRGQAGLGSQRDASSRATLSTINVFLAALGRTHSHPSKVMSVAWPPAENSNPKLKRAKIEVRPALSFSDEDNAGIIQPHDDALVVTLRIKGMM